MYSFFQISVQELTTVEQREVDGGWVLLLLLAFGVGYMIGNWIAPGDSE